MNESAGRDNLSHKNSACCDDEPWPHSNHRIKTSIHTDQHNDSQLFSQEIIDDIKEELVDTDELENVDKLVYVRSACGDNEPLMQSCVRTSSHTDQEETIDSKKEQISLKTLYIRLTRLDANSSHEITDFRAKKLLKRKEVFKKNEMLKKAKLPKNGQCTDTQLSSQVEIANVEVKLFDKSENLVKLSLRRRPARPACDDKKPLAHPNLRSNTSVRAGNSKLGSQKKVEVSEKSKQSKKKDLSKKKNISKKEKVCKRKKVSKNGQLTDAQLCSPVMINNKKDKQACMDELTDSYKRSGINSEYDDDDEQLKQLNQRFDTSIHTDQHTDTQLCSQNIVDDIKEELVDVDESTNLDILFYTRSAWNECEQLAHTNLLSNTSIHTDQRADEMPIVDVVASNLCDKASNKNEDSDMSERAFVCETCHKGYKALSGLQKHQIVPCKDTGLRAFVCETCNKGFKTSFILRKHYKLHGRKRQTSFACQTCCKTFSCPSALRTHDLTHTGERRFVCVTCGCAFKRKDALAIHQKVHGGERKYVRNKSLRKSSHVRTREDMQTGERRFVCHICGKRCTTKSNLNNHEMIHAGNRPFVCETCNKGFTKSYALLQHRIKHTGKREYICRTCGKGFFTRSYLRAHELLHTDARRFICDKCGKGFLYFAHLKTHHEKIHTKNGEYKSVCNVCGERFANDSQLVHHHNQMHTSGSKYVCKTCDKVFLKEFNLKVHSDIHSSERRYVCKICDKRFAQAAGLYMHKKCHSKSKRV